MAKSLKLVIFDCDGTLVDSQHMIVRGDDHGLCGARARRFPTAKRMLSIVGLSLIEAFTELGKGTATISGRKSRRTLQARLPRLARRAASISSRFIPARAKRSGARRAATTSCSASRPENRSAACAACSAITACSTTSSPSRPPTMRPRSPIPAWCSQRCARPARRRENTVVVGDTVYDIAMARAAGAAAIGVSWGYHTARFTDAQPALR